jgi:hypothetical protein
LICRWWTLFISAAVLSVKVSFKSKMLGSKLQGSNHLSTYVSMYGLIRLSAVFRSPLNLQSPVFLNQRTALTHSVYCTHPYSRDIVCQRAGGGGHL